MFRSLPIMREDFLHKKLGERKGQNALRVLTDTLGKTDFCSNDYLGLASSVFNTSQQFKHGSGGSRLLAGNYPLICAAEEQIAAFHEAEAGLIFNSGYDANIGLLSSVPQRGDTILYDFLSHASLRDGIRLSFANAFAFKHNDLADLESKLQNAQGNIFVVTESVFSMDGDMAPLEQISGLCKKYGAYLVVDEAHATGVIGENGAGLVQQLNITTHCFARIHTFGKAVGCHGAIVLGSHTLQQYLVNFSRSFIYTTSLPETSIHALQTSYSLFPAMQAERQQLHRLIERFQAAPLRYQKLISTTPIQAVVVPGNVEVKELAAMLQRNGFDIRPILYPTVPKNSERLRIVLHSFNTMEELDRLIGWLC